MGGDNYCNKSDVLYIFFKIIIFTIENVKFFKDFIRIYD